MEILKSFIQSFANMQGIAALVVVVVVCIGLYFVGKNRAMKLTTKDVVAIGIGAALYAGTSMIAITLVPNTSLRIAVALLSIFGALFGPFVGFLVGFIGHALNDAMVMGNVWWSWVFMSASVGLFSGLVTLSPSFNLKKGKMEKKHIGMMYVYSVLGVIVGSIISYFGDIFLYGEPSDKVWIQILVANGLNFVVIAAIGIPVVIGIAKLRNKSNDLEN